jgi:hypothetical protein
MSDELDDRDDLAAAIEEAVTEAAATVAEAIAHDLAGTLGRSSLFDETRAAPIVSGAGWKATTVDVIESDAELGVLVQTRSVVGFAGARFESADGGLKLAATALTMTPSGIGAHAFEADFALGDFAAVRVWHVEDSTEAEAIEEALIGLALRFRQRLRDRGVDISGDGVIEADEDAASYVRALDNVERELSARRASASSLPASAGSASS